MGRMVVTGIGPVSPVGIGKDELWEALLKGAKNIKETTKFTSDGNFYCGGIQNLNFQNYIKDNRVKRAADISKFALIAINLAKKDAKLNRFNENNTGIVFGITHGALNYTQELHKSLVTEKQTVISPALFSDSVLNAPAGNAAICFGINGPIHTLIGGSPVSLKAVILAQQMLNSKAIETLFIVSSEELSELTCFCYSKLGIGNLGEGGGAIVLTLEENIKKSDGYAYISGIASYFDPGDKNGAAIKVIEKSLKMASLEMKDVGFVMVDSFSGFFEGYFNNTPVGSTTHLTGNAFALTTLWNMSVAALVLKNRNIPESLILTGTNRYKKNDEIKNIVVCSADYDGMVCAVVLSSMQ